MKNNILKKIADKAYEFGFVSKIKTEIIERGLNEETIRLISKKKDSGRSKYRCGFQRNFSWSLD